ncbi:hypothetical protein HZS35_18275 [Pantoea brenneri]|jgi:hypothetical protein|nr:MULTISPECIES: hypothetical protein [Pantoea]MBZ6397010.1 hypothetical protein [Pantoea sp.]MBZ6440239.1 hypothetical protein [Pantoea sp.]NUY43497.1 hypothetical protein [Pantoea brenneri]NUY61234.1 hypothetical protein [Pantoea brenneri]NUY73469.1 hypothetical protein [Pantoea brenneri]
MKYETQKLIEQRFARYQTLPLLRREFENDTAVMAIVESLAMPEGFVIELLVQMVLHRRAPANVLIGILARFFDGDYQQTAAHLEYICANTELVNFDMQTMNFIINLDVSNDVKELMHQYQYLPPMIVPPLEVTGNRGSGYLNDRGDSLILKNNHHEGDLCYDSINRFNRVPLALNERVIRTIRNKRKNLDKPRDGESFRDYRKRVEAFERFEKDSMHTFALLVNEGNRFHLTHKVDKRLRTYCQGYHVSYQGNDYAKAVLQLADAELVE